MMCPRKSSWLALAGVALIAAACDEGVARQDRTTGSGDSAVGTDQATGPGDMRGLEGKRVDGGDLGRDQGAQLMDQGDAGSEQDGPAIDQNGVGLEQGGPIIDQTISAPDVQQPLTNEVLLFDQAGLQFTTGDNGFDPLVQPGDPLPASDWLSPHNYYDGEFQIRYVIQGPSGQEDGKLQVCIWTMPGYSPESCSSQVAYSGVGEYFNTSLAPSSWWKKDAPLDFSHPEKFLIRVVLRGADGCNVTTYNVPDACWSEWTKYEQMTYRVTIVLVPQGEVFSGWSAYP